MLVRQDAKVFAAYLLIAALLTNTEFAETDLSRLATVESLVERRSLSIDESFDQPKIDKLLVGGRYYSNKPPLLAVAGAIPYFILHTLGFSFRRNPELCTYIVTLSVVGVSYALLGVYFNKCLRLNGVGLIRSNFLTAVLLTCTPVLNYAVTYVNHTVAAFLVLAGFYFMKKSAENTYCKARAYMSGFSVGLCFAIDPPSGLVFGSAFLVYLTWVGNARRLTAYYILGLVLPFTAYCVLNLHVVGDLMPPLSHREFFDYPGSVTYQNPAATMDGMPPVAEPVHYIIGGLVGVHGIYSLSPIMLVPTLLFGYVISKGKHPLRNEALFLGAAIFVFCAFYFLMTGTYGASYGFRYLIPMYPLLLYFTQVYYEMKRSALADSIFLFLCFTSFFTAFLNMLPLNHAPWFWYCTEYILGNIVISGILSAYLVSNRYLMQQMRVYSGLS